MEKNLLKNQSDAELSSDRGLLRYPAAPDTVAPATPARRHFHFLLHFHLEVAGVVFTVQRCVCVCVFMNKHANQCGSLQHRASRTTELVLLSCC